jgi:hypothetical protein
VFRPDGYYAAYGAVFLGGIILFCKNCGEKLGDSPGKFCHHCGDSITTDLHMEMPQTHAQPAAAGTRKPAGKSKPFFVVLGIAAAAIIAYVLFNTGFLQGCQAIASNNYLPNSSWRCGESTIWGGKYCDYHTCNTDGCKNRNDYAAAAGRLPAFSATGVCSECRGSRCRAGINTGTTTITRCNKQTLEGRSFCAEHSHLPEH